MKPLSATGVDPNRVLLLLPTHRDAELTADVLGREGLSTTICRSASELATELARGAGAVFVGEELLALGAHQALVRAVEQQPRWSDLPILILTREGGDSRHISDALAQLGNVMLLERPLRLSALTSNVRTALRARERQYQINRHLEDLSHARDALAEVARRKDQFLAMLGHELRNPLAPIRNALHLFGADPSLAESHRELGQMMKRQVDHMVRLVDDLIDVSRISRGAIELRRERIELRDVIDAAVELGRPLIDAGEHDFSLDLPQAPMPLEADPVRLAQVFGNLLNNAAKYTPHGGAIALRARIDDGRLRVDITDTGIGIEPEMLSHVFELFTQGRREAHRAHDGLGIGLTLVRSIVEMHGGTVRAHSDGRGRGSVFTVELPAAVSVPVEVPRPRAGPCAAARPDAALRVLVVDDNVDSAESMGMVLELLGVRHEVVFSGQAALEAARRFCPDVVLLDIGMPGMDGYEVARHLRADAGTAQSTLIALTGWSQSQDRERSREAGFDHHLSKPVDIGALQSLIVSSRVQGDAFAQRPASDTACAARSRA